MSSDQNCGVCQGAGFDWRRAVDESRYDQVEDFVDYYRCPCVEVVRLRALVDDYENGINWQTTCTNCAKLLNNNYEQYCEIERLRAENAAFRAQYVFADEIREAFANWDGTDASLPEGWRREW